MTLKLYRFVHRHTHFAQCRTESLDLEALKEVKERMDKNPEITTGEISEISNNGPLYRDLSHGIATVDFIRGKAIKVGERHIDSRCTGTRRFYTMPEFEKEAREQFEKDCKAQKKRADAYYSQPWV